MYKAVRGISVLLRLALVSATIETLTITDNVLYSLVISFVIMEVIHQFSYETVGLYYGKGDFPVIGSLLYLFVNAIQVLCVWGAFSLFIWFEFVITPEIAVGITAGGAILGTVIFMKIADFFSGMVRGI